MCLFLHYIGLRYNICCDGLVPLPHSKTSRASGILNPMRSRLTVTLGCSRWFNLIFNFLSKATDLGWIGCGFRRWTRSSLHHSGYFWTQISGMLHQRSDEDISEYTVCFAESDGRRGYRFKRLMYVYILNDKLLTCWYKIDRWTYIANWRNGCIGILRNTPQSSDLSGSGNVQAGTFFPGEHHRATSVRLCSI
jgi:hypothetical protein